MAKCHTVYELPATLGFELCRIARYVDSVIPGFHYYRKYWSQNIEENLVCFHERNNAFVIFAIKTCKEDGENVGHLPRERSRTLKFLLDPQILLIKRYLTSLGQI